MSYEVNIDQYCLQCEVTSLVDVPPRAMRARHWPNNILSSLKKPYGGKSRSSGQMSSRRAGHGVTNCHPLGYQREIVLQPNGRTIKDRISERFMENIARVSNLTAIYTTHLAGAGRVRRGHPKQSCLGSVQNPLKSHSELLGADIR
jgi:hypothetical protein